MDKRPVIITAAVTGGQAFNRKHPSFPITPGQICDAVVEAARAGAAIAHLHVRDPVSGKGSRDPQLFREVVDRVRQTGVDIVLNLTGGVGGRALFDPEDETRLLTGSDVAGADERTIHIRDCLPEIASLDITTANQADGSGEYVYLNTPHTLRRMAGIYRQFGVKPELECFSAGDIVFGQQLLAEGLIDGPPLFQLVLGVKWGAPMDPETILYMRNMLPKGSLWTAMGTARQQFPAVAMSVLAGGHVRVGLEDNLYLSRGVFATNGELVERAARIIEDLGCAVAEPRQARQILGLVSPA